MTSKTSFGDCTDTSRLDPAKHVHFVQGMVLGVDDFRQEFSWHAGRHETIARELAGYGTISGLRVRVPEPGDAPLLAVEPGLAVTPAGQFARIKRRQCANLGEWLLRAENRARLPALEEMLGSPGLRGVRVYVRLRYRDCLVDDVPIPGEPCRTEEEALAASRIADSWLLHLSFEPPAQQEENALRELVHWLRRIPIVEHSLATPGQVAAALRAAAASSLAPTGPQPVELVLGDPPAQLRIGRDDLCECLRAALLVWTTELRPRVQEPFASGAPGCGCDGETSGSPPASAAPEQDVLLGELWVPLREVAGGLELDPSGSIELRQEQRPYVLHLRLLQELVSCGPDALGHERVASLGSVLAISEDTLLVWLQHRDEVDLSAPDALVISVNDVDASDFSLAPFGGVPNVFEVRFGGSVPILLQQGDRISLAFNLDTITERASGDTLHQVLDRSTGDYLDRRGNTVFVRTLVGALVLDELADVDAAGASNGQVLTFQDGRWHPAAVVLPPHTHALDELSDVSAATPAAGQVLTFQAGGDWRPQAVPRTLDDLADVIAPTAAVGQVLTFQTGAWRPQAVPRTLADLGDVAAPAPTAGQVLQFNGTRWVPTDVAAGNATPVHSGIALFTKIEAGSANVFGPFKHGLGRLVMVRLAIEPEEMAIEENTDTISAGVSFPRLVALHNDRPGEFFIYLEDTRDREGKEMDIRVRWYAVPVTQELDDQRAEPVDFPVLGRLPLTRAFARALVLREVLRGNTRVQDIADRFNVSPDALQPVLDELLAEKLIRIGNGVITPIG